MGTGQQINGHEQLLMGVKVRKITAMAGSDDNDRVMMTEFYNKDKLSHSDQLSI